MGKRIKRQTIKHIPQDIIEDILVNLPVKSLLRFKCVSRQWHSLISSKQFTKEHLKKSSDLIRHNLIYSSHDSRGLRSCSLKSFFHEQNYENYSLVKTSYHDSFLPNSGLFENIVGSCNGLILVTSKNATHWDNLILWNPSTRQVKIIPPPLYARKKCYLEPEYGFGYDDSTDDYKVVCIFFSRTLPYRTEMYSLRTNSWKKIEDFGKGYLWRYASVHVNGKLYWLGSVGGNEIIYSLSLVDAKFDIVAPPLPSGRDSFYTLHDLGGYLSVLFREDFKIVKEIWVMMKHGEVESWTNISHLRYANGPMNARIPQPIWLSKNGDVLVAFSKSWVTVCNAYRSRVYVVDAEIVRHDNIYVESLVSPFGNKKLCHKKLRQRSYTFFL